MPKGLVVAIGAAILAFFPNAWEPRPTVKPESVSTFESGVWWIGQPRALPALPPPAQVPAGGLWVSSTAAGTVALSALRFTVGEQDRQPIVTLPVNTSTTPPAALPISLGTPILACQATGNWAPPAKGTFGSLASAPKYDCSKGQVLGSPSVDGKTMVFELGQFVTDTNRTVSVVLVPGTVVPPLPASPVALPFSIPTILLPPTFDVTFKAVTPNAVEVLTSPLPNVLDDGALGVETQTAGAGDVASPTVVAGANSSRAGAARTTPPRRTGIAAVPGQVAQAAATVAHKGDSPRTRTIAAIVFLDLCLYGWWASNRDPLPGTPQAGRPYRSLYDGSAAPVATTRRPLTNREGKPPPLR
ncbi:MAG TPA: hypothetical protein VHD87_11295 [Acidimicrobiales bacterium]|nr:hypothetical protein [Acidimicrobiales bacterium]